MSLWGEFMLTIHLTLLILAMICFLCAAFNFQTQRITLLPLGLFFWVLAVTLRGM